MDAPTFTPSLPGLPDARSRLAAQVDFPHQVSQHARGTASQLAGLNLRRARRPAGAAHRPT